MEYRGQRRVVDQGLKVSSKGMFYIFNAFSFFLSPAVTLAVRFFLEVV